MKLKNLRTVFILSLVMSVTSANASQLCNESNSIQFYNSPSYNLVKSYVMDKNLLLNSLINELLATRINLDNDYKNNTNSPKKLLVFVDQLNLLDVIIDTFSMDKVESMNAIQGFNESFSEHDDSQASRVKLIKKIDYLENKLKFEKNKLATIKINLIDSKVDCINIKEYNSYSVAYRKLKTDEIRTLRITNEFMRKRLNELRSESRKNLVTSAGVIAFFGWCAYQTVKYIGTKNPGAYFAASIVSIPAYISLWKLPFDIESVVSNVELDRLESQINRNLQEISFLEKTFNVK